MTSLQDIVDQEKSEEQQELKEKIAYHERCLKTYYKAGITDKYYNRSKSFLKYLKLKLGDDFIEIFYKTKKERDEKFKESIDRWNIYKGKNNETS